MKKTLFAVATIVFTTAAFSQVQFGFQVIGNAGNATIKSEKEPVLNCKKPRFYCNLPANVLHQQ